MITDLSVFLKTKIAMEDYQKDFIELALREKALGFGEFTLKSGRISPYFFNAGAFSSGSALANLGRCYAVAIMNAGIEFDVLFGPAYKGIPLAVATAMALSDNFGRDYPYAFNRKEAKGHGEGGNVVGTDLRGKRVLIIDDVITAGTAVAEVMALLNREGGHAAGVVIGLDRRERGPGPLSAVREVERSHGVPVTSIIAIDDIIGYLEHENGDEALLSSIIDYRQRYGEREDA